MIDGTRSDTVIAASTPALDSMMKNGLWTMEAMTHDSILTNSGPGWRSILTGVNREKHGNFDNNHFFTVNSDYKSFLWHARVEYGLRTLVMLNLNASDWEDFLNSLFETDSTDQILNSFPEDVELASDQYLPLWESDEKSVETLEKLIVE